MVGARAHPRGGGTRPERKVEGAMRGWVWRFEASERDDVRALREENERLHAVLGRCPRCIAVLDGEGKLTGYNREFERVFEVPPPLGAELSGLTDTDRARFDE